MMGNLNNHFGDDATVDPARAVKITDYLVSNAADTGGRRYSDKLLRGVSTTGAPLRITDLPKWVKRAPQGAGPGMEDTRRCAQQGQLRWLSHADAERGYYDE
jgi:hypothetical protein